MKGLIKLVLLSTIVSLCLFGCVLNSQSGIFREYEAALLSLRWMLLVCLAVWCGTFIFLTFNLNDLPLIGLLFVAITVYFIGYAESQPATDALILLAGVTLGRGTQFLLKADGRWQMEDGENDSEIGNQSETSHVVSYFLVGLVLLLAFSSWWHLDMIGVYHGPRWMGLWNNPNDYGMLMSVGVLLATGLLVDRRWKLEDEENSRSQKSESGIQKFLRSLCSFAAMKSATRNWQSAILLVAGLMLETGLVMSYSRGAWLGSAIGLFYLAKVYGKFKWRYVVTGLGLLAFGILLFWGRTPDSAPWYAKRMDFDRPSAQHRVAAWKAGFEIMRDHPFGVGWNKVVETYDKDYSPPEDGAAAITTNDYLMLGTQLGIPGLLCFVTYVVLCFRSPKSKAQSPKLGNGVTLDIGHWTLDTTQVACRAAALAMLVEFWFDGGLFKLATAAVFWVLLELGANSEKPREYKIKS